MIGGIDGRVGPARDRLVWVTGMMAVAVLAWMIVYVFVKGIGAIDWEFFTTDMSEVGPLNPGGGSLHAIIGTLEQTAIATVLAVPIGIMTAVYLNELKGGCRRSCGSSPTP